MTVSAEIASDSVLDQRDDQRPEHGWQRYGEELDSTHARKVPGGSDADLWNGALARPGCPWGTV